MADQTEDRPTPSVLDEPYDAPHHGRVEDVWEALGRGLLVVFTLAVLAAIVVWSVILFIQAST